ncbi:SDR family NAD(P)-dependent oxidoreductase [Nocardioides alcanivorans]|uniref:SDR family NAD(P)-dependent oxidoreductase n=1 Tax=Nocardioides alcanivorans TaxID=2897352 RepID=UPI0024B0A834|nr:SDR family NAD(P)-dependent oxidoreductase [Nocardioides alcanivorans]
MSLSIDLTGRVALVTGGTKGIGAGIAATLVEAGAHVVTCARSEVTPAPGTTHVVCDVRDADAVHAMIDGIVAEHGRLDIAVNNAGERRTHSSPTDRRVSTTRSWGSTSPPCCWLPRPPTG